MDGSFFATTRACGKRTRIAGSRLPGVRGQRPRRRGCGPVRRIVVPSAMAKAAVHAMTMSLAVEWGPKNIRLNAVAPGPFPTESAWAKLSPIPGAAVGATQPDQVPLRRYGEIDELKNLMILLMSDACNYINGATIAIDGGHHLAAPSTFADLRNCLTQIGARPARLYGPRPAKSARAGACNRYSTFHINLRGASPIYRHGRACPGHPRLRR